MVREQRLHTAHHWKNAKQRQREQWDYWVQCGRLGVHHFQDHNQQLPGLDAVPHGERLHTERDRLEQAHIHWPRRPALPFHTQLFKGQTASFAWYTYLTRHFIVKFYRLRNNFVFVIEENFTEYAQLRQEADFYRIEPIISQIDFLFHKKLGLDSPSSSSLVSLVPNEDTQSKSKTAIYFTVVSKLHQGK